MRVPDSISFQLTLPHTNSTLYLMKIINNSDPTRIRLPMLLVPIAVLLLVVTSVVRLNDRSQVKLQGKHATAD